VHGERIGIGLAAQQRELLSQPDAEQGEQAVGLLMRVWLATRM
jgi:hypothetical protein